jgi:ribose 5-phosphate isomerase B
MAIAANRFKGIRAGVCWSANETILARSDDDINVLCLPVEMFEDGKDVEIWKAIVKAFLETEFKDGEKYSRRVEKLDRLS